MREKQLFHWAARGLGGIIRMMESWQAGGAKADSDWECDMVHVQERVANLVRANRGEPIRPVLTSPSWPEP